MPEKMVLLTGAVSVVNVILIVLRHISFGIIYEKLIIRVIRIVIKHRSSNNKRC